MDLASERLDARTIAHRCDLRWSQLARGLVDDPALRATLTDTLRAADAEAVFWECVPWPLDDDPPFELVLVDAPPLVGLRPDAEAFAEHFDDEADVATFSNLGGDAQLVVPAPRAPIDVYPHLVAFVRGAPPAQVDATWVALGHAIARWRAAGEHPLYVSTSGLGVSWVHLRLDRRPKYFTHAPYRR